MLTEGIVYKKKGSMAHIKCARPQSCEHCENSAICSKNESELRAYDPFGVSEGDLVEVETREDAKSVLVISYIFLVHTVFSLSIRTLRSQGRYCLRHILQD